MPIELEREFTVVDLPLPNNEQEPCALGMSMATEKVVPSSCAMPKPIQQVRDWAKGRARPASGS